jgi:hypothetical protein
MYCHKGLVKNNKTTISLNDHSENLRGVMAEATVQTVTLKQQRVLLQQANQESGESQKILLYSQIT